MEYKNDLEAAYQLYQHPLDRKDLEWLFYEGYERMIEERARRITTMVSDPSPGTDHTADEEEDLSPEDIVAFGENIIIYWED